MSGDGDVVMDREEIAANTADLTMAECDDCGEEYLVFLGTPNPGQCSDCREPTRTVATNRTNGPLMEFGPMSVGRYR